MYRLSPAIKAQLLRDWTAILPACCYFANIYISSNHKNTVFELNYLSTKSHLLVTNTTSC